MRTCYIAHVTISEDIFDFDFKYNAPSAGLCGALHLKQIFNWKILVNRIFKDCLQCHLKHLAKFNMFLLISLGYFGNSRFFFQCFFFFFSLVYFVKVKFHGEEYLKI